MKLLPYWWYDWWKTFDEFSRFRNGLRLSFCLIRPRVSIASLILSLISVLVMLLLKPLITLMMTWCALSTFLVCQLIELYWKLWSNWQPNVLWRKRHSLWSCFFWILVVLSEFWFDYLVQTLWVLWRWRRRRRETEYRIAFLSIISRVSFHSSFNMVIILLLCQSS